MKNTRPFAPIARARQSAFTLIEVLVVISIIIILLAVSIPTIKALTKGNSQSQAVNMIRSYLANARSIAISERRETGVVFFDESTEFSSMVNSRQTAMQIFQADPNQAQYSAASRITVYIARQGTKQYLPSDIMVAALFTDPNGAALAKTGENSFGFSVRCLIFDSNGQVVIRNNVASPLKTANYDATKKGQYPTAYGDWRFTTPSGSGHTGVPNLQGSATSTNMVFVFNKSEYLTASSSFTNDQAGDTNRTTWLQQHADVLVINPYTGAPIQ